MFEIIGLILSFIAIMLLILKKVNQALAILIGTLILGVSSSLPPLSYWRLIITVLFNAQNYELILAIGLIGSLGNLLKETGVMADLTQELKKLISKRSIIATIPAIMGLLPMPGGALLSAPMIEEEMIELGISNELKTVINIAFRHIWFWVLPLSSGIIFEMRFSNLDLPSIIRTQYPFSLLLLAMSIALLWLKVKDNDPKDTNHGSIKVFTLVSSLGPIAIAIILNVLGVSLYLALIPSFLVVFLIKCYPIQNYSFSAILKKIVSGIPWTLVAATFTILLFREVSTETGVFTTLFTILQSYGVPPFLFAFTFPFIVGFVSALPTTAIPLVFPMVLPMLNAISVPLAVTLIYSCAITGYLISPLHMCFFLTNSYYKADLIKTYKYWMPLILITLLGGTVLVFVLNRP